MQRLKSALPSPELLSGTGSWWWPCTSWHGLSRPNLQICGFNCVDLCALVIYASAAKPMQSCVTKLPLACNRSGHSSHMFGFAGLGFLVTKPCSDKASMTAYTVLNASAICCFVVGDATVASYSNKLCKLYCGHAVQELSKQRRRRR